MILRLFRASQLPAIMGVVLFVAAGRLSVPAFWAYIVVMWLIFLPVAVLVHDPELAKERLKPGPGGIDAGFLKVAAPLCSRTSSSPASTLAASDGRCRRRSRRR